MVSLFWSDNVHNKSYYNCYNCSPDIEDNSYIEQDDNDSLGKGLTMEEILFPFLLLEIKNYHKTRIVEEEDDDDSLRTLTGLTKEEILFPFLFQRLRTTREGLCMIQIAWGHQ